MQQMLTRLTDAFVDVAFAHRPFQIVIVGIYKRNVVSACVYGYDLRVVGCGVVAPKSG